MDYKSLNDMTRRFLNGHNENKNDSKILSILETIVVSGIDNEKKLNEVKKMVKNLERKCNVLLENNETLLKILESEPEKDN